MGVPAVVEGRNAEPQQLSPAARRVIQKVNAQRGRGSDPAIRSIPVEQWTDDEWKEYVGITRTFCADDTHTVHSDHLAKHHLCVCRLCRCGKHPCPKKPWSSHFVEDPLSEYRHKYPPRDVGPRPRRPPRPLEVSDAPFIDRTTHRDDFTPKPHQKRDPTWREKPKDPDFPPRVVNPGSEYQTKYKEHPVLPKFCRDRERSYAGEVPFLGNSTYDTDYDPKKTSNVERSRQTPPGRGDKWSKLPRKFDEGTIYKDEYRKWPLQKRKPKEKAPIETLPFAGASTYDTDFDPKKASKVEKGRQTPLGRNEMWAELPRKFDGGSIYTDDYLKWPLEKSPPRERAPPPEILPFAGASTYDTDYDPKQASKVEKARQTPPGRCERWSRLPRKFDGGTIYTDEYLKWPLQKRKGKEKPTIETIPFAGASTYDTDYDPKKTSKVEKGRQTPLGRSGKRHIFVIVDRFSKYAGLITMPETAKTDYAIKLFLDNWVRDFGLPTSIVSDKDVRFTSELWQTTTEQMGTKLQMTSGNHPESNGQAEQMNRVVQHLLRHYIKPSQDDWDEKLPLVASLYHNAVHSTTGMTPNQLHLGWKPKSALDFLLPERQPTAALGSIEFPVQYEQMLQQAVEHIRKSQDAMIACENKHRRPSNFHVGDRVWVKSSEPGQEMGISRKLMPQYFGPWEILDIVGDQPDGPSYVIRTAPHLRTYPVFHASKLAPFAATDQFPSKRSILPPTMDGEVDIDQIVEHRLMPVPRPPGRGCPPKPKMQYQVRFRHHLDPNEDRWFTREELMRTAPQVIAGYERDLKGKMPAE
ncbi:hypothetical protein CBR_g45760 [Chara braunii]|uniref:Integrase catalytic domain-containing protein n=1 Tax=Chara braunii TaxID=69332 RepID=A0A388LZ59_CHABU|nr:hypothetical protein CBR_g45760 [Chara braunii]|eukprot:GBG87608.1 hypothetical protein CBR_g45760 [Chara braunii]